MLDTLSIANMFGDLGRQSVGASHPPAVGMALGVNICLAAVDSFFRLSELLQYKYWTV